MDTQTWLGSHTNLSEYQERQARLNAALATSQYSETEPNGFSLHGNVAVLDISGPLVNSESWLNDLFGLTSYTRIRNNLIEAASHPDVGAIVLNIDSGGGTPNGLPDVAQLIRRINAAVPVSAYTGGTLASAAYWLGSAADKVYAGPTANVGSIGVIATLMDRTEQFKQDGLTPVVLRAGSRKALANPYEPVTKEVKAEVQSQIDQLYQVFVDTVAEHRGVSPTRVMKDMADGREFIGDSAVQAGLVDGITTLDALVGGLQTKLETRRGKETNMAKKTLLTEKQVALIAEGVDPQLAIEGATEESTLEAQASETPETPEAVVLPEEPPIEAAVAPSPASGNELTAFLQAELASKSAEVTQLSIKLAEAERELNGYKAHHDNMKAIVAASINRMQVGLGGMATDMQALSAEALLAQHAQIAATFGKTFPVGGVAAVTAEEPAPSKKTDPMAQARLRAVKSNSK